MTEPSTSSHAQHGVSSTLLSSSTWSRSLRTNSRTRWRSARSHWPSWPLDHTQPATTRNGLVGRIACNEPKRRSIPSPSVRSQLAPTAASLLRSALLVASHEAPGRSTCLWRQQRSPISCLSTPTTPPISPHSMTSSRCTRSDQTTSGPVQNRWCRWRGRVDAGLGHGEGWEEHLDQRADPDGKHRRTHADGTAERNPDRQR